MTETTGTVFRVRYRRTNWKSDTWKTKLFNTETQARRYIENLLAPVTDKTPERYAKLGQVEIAPLSWMTGFWSRVPEHEVIPPWHRAPLVKRQEEAEDGKMSRAEAEARALKMLPDIPGPGGKLLHMRAAREQQLNTWEGRGLIRPEYSEAVGEDDKWNG